MPTTEAQKRANQKWREANRAKSNAMQLPFTKKWANKNKEHISIQKKAYYESVKNKYKSTYLFKKEAKIFFNILL